LRCFWPGSHGPNRTVVHFLETESYKASFR
jgi:hypothetical protein